MSATISISDLEMAVDFASLREFETAAYVCRATGRVYYYGEDDPSETDAPEDPDAEETLVQVPTTRDLDLGQRLIRQFMHETAPDLAEDVSEIFRSRGAYARYKSFLERHDLLQRWYDYERAATLGALKEWAEENGLVVEE